MKTLNWSASLVMAAAMSAASCGSGGSGGPIDGTWKVSSLTCNGTAQPLGSFVVVINNTTGSLLETYSATCVGNVTQTYSYSAGNSFTMTPQSIVCSPSSGCGTIFGGQSCAPLPPKLDYTYSLAANNLTFSRTAGANEPCPMGQAEVFVGTAM